MVGRRLSGADALKRIDTAIRELRAEEETVAAKLKDDNHEIARLNEALAARFTELAEIRLREIERKPVGEIIDRTDREVRELLAGRAEKLDEIAGRAAELDAGLAAMHKRRDGLAKALEAAEKSVEEAESDLQAKLASDSGFTKIRDAVTQAAATADEAARKTEIARTDRTEKGRPYEDDPLFMYLWNCGFGTAAYNSSGLVRFLDRWVAGLIGYAEARPMYAMLLQIPERLSEHAERLAAEVGNARAAYDAALDKARRKHGAQKVFTARDEARDALAALDAEIAAENGKRSGLEAERQAVLDDGGGGRDAALKLMQDTLRSTSLRELHRIALLTPMPEDERIVEAIDDIADEIEDEQEDAVERQKMLDSLARRRAELEEIRARFVNDGYASGGSWFEGGDFLKVLLAEIMRGAMSGGGLWREIERHSRSSRSSPFEFPFPTGGSSGPIFRPRSGGSIWKGGWPGGGSGGGWGGSRGGGGSRSGGGSRGGGGFRTGGGF